MIKIAKKIISFVFTLLNLSNKLKNYFMKKLLLLLLISSSSFITAQVIQADDFEALTVGNVGTDATGVTSGQGSYYTLTSNGTAPTTGTNSGNSNFQIVTTGNNATKGLKITCSNGNKGNRFMWKDGLGTAWSGRTTGNNIIEVEYDMFTGPATTSTAQVGVRLYGTDNTVTPSVTRTLNGFVYNMDTRILQGVCYLNNSGTYATYLITLTTGGLILSPNTWYRIGFAYDTITGETIWKASTVYTGLPAANWAGPFAPNELDFVSTVPTTPANAIASDMTFDNLSVKATPTEALLGINSNQLTDNSFSVYPNPAINVINFSNTVNAVVKSIELADLNGRVIKSLKINAPEGQISVSDLGTGIYMMKITSDQGVAVKKIVKQ